MIIVSDILKNKLPKAFDWFYLPTSPFLPREVAFHTDLRIFSFKDELLCAPSIFDTIKKNVNIPVLCGEKEPTGNYPNDVPYNAITIGKYLMCNPDTIDPSIITEADKHGLTNIEVRQGYTRCSVAVVCDIVGKEAIITADEGIAKIAKEHNIDCLKIRNEGIKLDGFNYGFIGGATITACEDLLFFGNPATHPDGKKIIEFCKEYNVNIVSLSEGPLTDYGSGIYF